MSSNINDYDLAKQFFGGLDLPIGRSPKIWYNTSDSITPVKYKEKYVMTNIPNITIDNPMNKEILRHINKVIFHKPATIVYFDDGDKVVVKTYKDNKFNPEAGLALCILKKMLGNDAEKFHKFFKDWGCNKHYD